MPRNEQHANAIILPAWKVGMLNCAGPTADDPICVPDSGMFPAKDAPDFRILANSGRSQSVFSRHVSEPAKLAIQTDDGGFCACMILHDHSLFFLPCASSLHFKVQVAHQTKICQMDWLPSFQRLWSLLTDSFHGNSVEMHRY